MNPVFSAQRPSYPFVVICSLCLCMYFLLVYPFAFNYEINIVHQYELLAIFSVLSIGYVLTTFRDTAGVAAATLLLGIAYLYVHNEYLTVILCLGMMGIFLWKAGQQMLVHVFRWGNLAWLCYEITIAIIQFSNGAPLTGSLMNTGVFAIYLASMLPLLTYSKPKALSIILALLILLIIIQTQSRTAQLAVAALAVLYLYHTAQARIKRLPKALIILLIVLLLAGAVAAVYYMLSFKQMSASGRLLMNRIALQHIWDHFWLGTGAGKFTWYYPQWQAQYFQHAQVHLSADESYIIFNEYLQLFETIGVFGFILFGALLTAFYTTRSSSQKNLLYTLKLTVTAILLCGFTSYPLHINILLFELLLCFIIAFKTDERKFPFKKRIVSYGMPIAAICLLISGAFTFLIARKHFAVKAWQSSGRHEELYPLLQQDGKFLTDYGIALSGGPKAIEVLEAARERFISKATIEALAQAYEASNDYGNAIRCYEWETNYLPNLFEPKLHLLNLYIRTGDISKAEKIGKAILETTPKIPSVEVDYIKRQARLMLEKSEGL